MWQSESDSDNSSKHSNSSEEGTHVFDLILSEQEWIEIKPNDANENTKPNGNSGSELARLRLKPRYWTNTISEAFWLQFRMPCAFGFKRAVESLSLENSYVFKICGRCRSVKCGNTFNGYAEKFVDEKGLTVKVKTRDTRFTAHDVVKDFLNRQRRKKIQQQVKAEGCSKWRKRQAREHMPPGETEPPHLPSNDVIRQAKKETVDSECGVKKDDGRDVIKTLTDMSH